MIKTILSDILSPSVRAVLFMWVRMFMFFVSIVTVSAVVVDYGFVLDEGEMKVVQHVYSHAWWIYFISYIIHLCLDWMNINRKTVFMTTLLGLLLVLTAVSEIFVPPADGHAFAWLWDVSSNKFIVIATLLLFAALEISKGVVSFINKNTNPALLMAVCFAVIILFGALLLLLPRSTHEHIRLSLIDALFVSTSAVCVTGLSTVDVAQTFSLEGQIVIALLIQIGGLGVMTITSFFAMFFMGGTGLYNQFALRDMVGSDTFSSLISTLLYILGFTFSIELLGACCIWFSIHGTLGLTLHEELFFSVFHAISAFCNAGFSTLTGNLGNDAILYGHNSFFLIISVLVILGGIGFPILMNFKRVVAYSLRKFLWRKPEDQSRPRYIHLTNINTKIVLVTTVFLLIGGTLLVALLEWNGAFAGMTTGERLVQSFFTAVVPRTAGFNSVDLTGFSLLTILVYMFLMWIGGASQSTAGGIKVNTFAVALANMRAVVYGENAVVLFKREITPDSVSRASAVIFGSIVTILFSFVTLLFLEPNLSPKGLLFEVVSAYSTVGASLNVTPELGNAGKLLIVALMFVGRVGLITVLMSMTRQRGSRKFRYPKGNVIIN
ncbi:MAG: potassium transporter [Bacteroidaceae bacterium]|nr:potassium transporter [Bacteroidaceae bacterium]